MVAASLACIVGLALAVRLGPRAWSPARAWGTAGPLPAWQLWTQAGHDLGNSFANVADSAVTAANVSQLRLQWLVRADAGVSGAPVVGSYAVFFGTWKGTLYAVSRRTGKVLWRRAAGSGSAIHGSPLLSAGRVYVASVGAAGGRIYCYEASSGRPAWVSGPLWDPGVTDDVQSSVVRYGDVLYVGFGGERDLRTERGGVAAVSVRDGHVLWRKYLVFYDGGGAAVLGTPAVIPRLGILVVGTGNPAPFPGNPNAAAVGPVPAGPDYDSDALVGLSLSNGHIVFAQQVHAHDGHGPDFLGSPNAWTTPDGRVLAGDGNRDGSYYAVDARTGHLAWRADLATVGGETLITDSAAVADGRVYVGALDRPQSVLAKGQRPAGHRPPAVGRLVALDATTGRVEWTFRAPVAFSAAPAVGDGVLLALGADGTLFALDPTAGRLLWKGSVGGRMWHAEVGVTLAGRQVLVPLSQPGGVAVLAVNGR